MLAWHGYWRSMSSVQPGLLFTGRCLNHHSISAHLIATRHYIHSHSVFAQHVRLRQYASAATASNQAVEGYNGRASRSLPSISDERLAKLRLEREIQFLGDPLKLADHTLRLLRQDSAEKALEIVRLAGRNISCTVSWNHLIDHEMAKGRVNRAVKLYNEMKKRGQPPDSYTYTLLLRGLAGLTDYPTALAKALSIYHSMYAANSPVRPSIIHTNAVLKVCARARDLDALFGVAAQLPSKGRGAADAWTFTTILHAVRAAAVRRNDVPDVSPAEYRQLALRAVLQGRRMWEDIVGRWRAGELSVDEEMVCAMGRLLLLSGQSSDCDDVLSLVQQTMGISREIPRIGEPARQTHLLNTEPESASRGLDSVHEEPWEEDDRSYDFDDGSVTPISLSRTDASLGLSDSNTSINHTKTEISTIQSDAETSLNLSEHTSADPPHESNPFATATPSTGIPVTLARPGCNTLSLLVEACTRMRASAAAQAYWGKLSDPNGPYKVVPDAENYTTYLRLLRLTRASRLAVALLRDMLTPREAGGLGLQPGQRGKTGQGRVQPKTFRIVMSTCARDALNARSLERAGEVMRLMMANLEDPDAQTVFIYVKLLGKHLTLMERGQRRPGSALLDWRPVAAGLDEVQVAWRNMKSLLAYGSWSDDSNDAETSQHTRRPRPRSTARQSMPALERIDTRQRLEMVRVAAAAVTVYDRLLSTYGEQMGQRERSAHRERAEPLRAWRIRQATFIRNRRLASNSTLSPHAEEPEMDGDDD